MKSVVRICMVMIGMSLAAAALAFKPVSEIPLRKSYSPDSCFVVQIEPKDGLATVSCRTASGEFEQRSQFSLTDDYPEAGALISLGGDRIVFFAYYYHTSSSHLIVICDAAGTIIRTLTFDDLVPESLQLQPDPLLPYGPPPWRGRKDTPRLLEDGRTLGVRVRTVLGEKVVHVELSSGWVLQPGFFSNTRP